MFLFNDFVPVNLFSSIQEAFNASKSVYFPSNTTYTLDRTVDFMFDNTIVKFGTNVKVVASNGIKKMFNNTGFHGITFDGEGAEFDLNGTADYILSVNNSQSYLIKNTVIKNVYGYNRPDTTLRWESAIEVRKCSGASVENIKISDYAYNNVEGEESYCIGVFFSENVRINGFDFNNNFIGVLVQDSPNTKINDFNIKGMKDNAIYVLSNSPYTKVTNGFIENAEEGVVTYSDHMLVDEVYFVNNTNKAVTLRKTNYTKITNCTMIGCKTALGDDGAYDISFIDFNHNTIVDCLEYAVYLRKLSNTKIEHNRLTNHAATLDMIRISGATSTDNIGNSVSFNTINDVNKTSVSAITMTAGDGSNSNEIKQNTLVAAKVGVKFYKTSGSGLNGNYVFKNVYRNVDQKTSFSGGLTNIVDEY